MSNELEHLVKLVARGRHSRRDFLGRAAALGVGAAAANSMIVGAARAEGPQKGGTLKVGLQGGESTNSLDPALAASTVPFVNLRCFGDTLATLNPDGSLDMRLAESVGSSPTP